MNGSGGEGISDMRMSDCRVVKAALLASAFMILILTIQLRSTQRNASVWVDRANSLVVGSVVPLVEAHTIGGEVVVLGRSAAGQIYFVYNTLCRFCERSLPAWQELAARFDEAAIEVIGISLGSGELASRYQSDHKILFTSIAVDDERFRDTHRFWVVPQTIVVDSEGRVTFSRIGVLERPPAIDSVVAAVERMLRSGTSGKAGP